ncbi:staphylococcus aureus paralogous family [Staphylococcus schweitzeri]|nr:staphylococcus aureus paralogous family [Staphylococcus schweitzeri]CDR60595.1 staphylococcus aureus paralogous family [Staphylococcus schweitzeri]CDR67176.1 staphylococcus aureus paralogous family [Staphylococcus schweitzeri]
MVDLANNWLTLLLPMMNWLIPKKYVKISKEEFENLKIVKPTKNRVFWPAVGGSILFGVTFRKYTHLLDIQLEKSLVIIICFITFLSILIFFMKLNQKLKLKVFNKNKEHKEKVMLLPTFKHFYFVLFSYLFSGFFSIMSLCMLITLDSQNIIVFIAWIIMTMLFFLVNMASIGNKNVHVIFKKIDNI